jgi:hypothetical protein
VKERVDVLREAARALLVRETLSGDELREIEARTSRNGSTAAIDEP